MGIAVFRGVIITGNFCRVTKRKPKNWVHNGYKMIVPFDFKWRHRSKKHECTCKTCLEAYQPYYGTSWYHSDECYFAGRLIAQTE